MPADASVAAGNGDAVLSSPNGAEGSVHVSNINVNFSRFKAPSAATTTAVGSAPTGTVATTSTTVTAAVFFLCSAVLFAIAAAMAPVAPKANTPTATTAAAQFSVWSWNVQRGYALDGTLNLDSVAELALDEGVDLLAMQESEASGPITGGRDVPGYIASAMGEQYEVVYGAGGDPLHASFDGTAIVSKFPVLSSASHRLWRYGVFPTFTLTECTVSLGPDANVTLLNVHPTLIPIDMRESAVAFLIERVRVALLAGGGAHTNSSSAAVVVTGDFNIDVPSLCPPIFLISHPMYVYMR